MMKFGFVFPGGLPQEAIEFAKESDLIFAQREGILTW
jgi:hypothetical protein